MHLLHNTRPRPPAGFVFAQGAADVCYGVALMVEFKIFALIDNKIAF
jgi:hypothetical protein